MGNENSHRKKSLHSSSDDVIQHKSVTLQTSIQVGSTTEKYVAEKEVSSNTSRKTLCGSKLESLHEHPVKGTVIENQEIDNLCQPEFTASQADNIAVLDYDFFEKDIGIVLSNSQSVKLGKSEFNCSFNYNQVSISNKSMSENCHSISSNKLAENSCYEESSFHLQTADVNTIGNDEVCLELSIYNDVKELLEFLIIMVEEKFDLKSEPTYIFKDSDNKIPGCSVIDRFDKGFVKSHNEFEYKIDDTATNVAFQSNLHTLETSQHSGLHQMQFVIENIDQKLFDLSNESLLEQKSSFDISLSEISKQSLIGSQKPIYPIESHTVFSPKHCVSEELFSVVECVVEDMVTKICNSFSYSDITFNNVFLNESSCDRVMANTDDFSIDSTQSVCNSNNFEVSFAKCPSLKNVTTSSFGLAEDVNLGIKNEDVKTAVINGCTDDAVNTFCLIATVITGNASNENTDVEQCISANENVTNNQNAHISAEKVVLSKEVEETGFSLKNDIQQLGFDGNFQMATTYACTSLINKNNKLTNVPQNIDKIERDTIEYESSSTERLVLNNILEIVEKNMELYFAENRKNDNNNITFGLNNFSLQEIDKMSISDLEQVKNNGTITLSDKMYDKGDVPFLNKRFCSKKSQVDLDEVVTLNLASEHKHQQEINKCSISESLKSFHLYEVNQSCQYDTNENLVTCTQESEKILPNTGIQYKNKSDTGPQMSSSCAIKNAPETVHKPEKEGVLANSSFDDYFYSTEMKCKQSDAFSGDDIKINEKKKEIQNLLKLEKCSYFQSDQLENLFKVDQVIQTVTTENALSLNEPSFTNCGNSSSLSMQFSDNVKAINDFETGTQKIVLGVLEEKNDLCISSNTSQQSNKNQNSLEIVVDGDVSNDQNICSNESTIMDKTKLFNEEFNRPMHNDDLQGNCKDSFDLSPVLGESENIINDKRIDLSEEISLNAKKVSQLNCTKSGFDVCNDTLNKEKLFSETANDLQYAVQPKTAFNVHFSYNDICTEHFNDININNEIKEPFSCGNKENESQLVLTIISDLVDKVHNLSLYKDINVTNLEKVNTPIYYGEACREGSFTSDTELKNKTESQVVNSSHNFAEKHQSEKHTQFDIEPNANDIVNLIPDDVNDDQGVLESRELRLFDKGVRLFKKKQDDEKKGFAAFKTSSVASNSAVLYTHSTSSSISSSDHGNSFSLDSSLDIKNALSQLEEKYKQAMVHSAQLDNERSQMHYQMQLLKDLLEDQEDQYYRLSLEHKATCQELEKQKRAYSALDRKCTDLQEALRQRDELIQELTVKHKNVSILIKDSFDLNEAISWKDKKIKEQGLVVVGEGAEEEVDGMESGDDTLFRSKIALVTHEAAQVLQSAGEGSLDVQLKTLAEEKEDLLEQVRRLKIELDEERKKVPVNGEIHNESRIPELQLLEIQRDANRQINDYKLKLQKSEQDFAACQSHISRLDGQVHRLKQVSENYEKQEDEMRAEKRKLMRDHRAALDRIEELEMTNSHLEKRLERMKATRTALTQS